MNKKELEHEFYRRLQAEGLWIPQERTGQMIPVKPFKPVEVKGKPLSEMIIEDRR